MFSQWRHAVESLAQAQPPRSSQDASAEEAHTRSSSDGGIRTSLSSSSQLAESALSNLRKSLVSQRAGPATVGQPAATSPTPVEPAPTPAPTPRSARSTLEDRLRAKFAIGDASGSSTPAPSTRATPSPVPMTDHPLAASPTPPPNEDVPIVKGPPNPLSPTSTPLPDSPLASPTTEEPLSLHIAAEIISPETPSADIPTTVNDAEPEASENSATSIPEAPSVDSAEPTSVSEEISPEHLQPSTRDDVAEDYSSLPEQQVVVASSTESPEPEVVALALDEPKLPSGESVDTPHETGEADTHPEILTNGCPAEPQDVPAGAAVTVPADSTTSVPSIQLDVSRPSTPHGKIGDGVDVDALQKRLKLVEQRFADVSTSFKRLQAEKVAADRVLRELTPVESVSEVEALREYFQNMNMKTEMAQDEIRRLTGKLTRQDERIEELRDIHRLESKSQSDQIEKLRAQVDEAEKLFKAAEDSSSRVEQEAAKNKAEINRLQGELEKAIGSAKDEEEKRSKAIALLKTVRQKLVKAEKDRDDAMKEVVALREAEKVEREKEKAERTKLHAEIDKVNTEREIAVQGLRAQFDKEVVALKEKHDKEIAALRSQYELEAITTKTTHVKEIESKKARISDLEGSVRALSREKDELFDQLQLRQAEMESLRSSLESLQGQNTELQYQLHEAQDRVSLLQDEFSDARRDHDLRVQPSGPSTEEVTRLLAAAESKYEAKLGDLRRRLVEAERERDEGEAHWSKKLAERAREVESLKATINTSLKSKEEDLESAQTLRKEIESLQGEIRAYQKQISELHTQSEKAAEVEHVAKSQLAELSAKAADLQQLVDESKGREAQLRNQNKTLREELRKVQSSVALLEKQRGPGVGYWASRNESTPDVRSPTSSVSDLIAKENSSSRPSSPSTVKSDEEVNFEYLRNVIMQFLEHKEMRPHLIRILSTILRFTPQETRRLISKV